MADIPEPAESAPRRLLRAAACRAVTAAGPLRRGIGGIGRLLGRLLPGAAARRVQTAAFALESDQANAEALQADGPLWVVIGDSTSQGIGASTVQGGYVMRVLDWLRRDGRPWRVVNLSNTGAGIADVLNRQLPALADITERHVPELVTVAIGSNDLVHRTPELGKALRELASRLPAGAVVATLPQGLRPRIAQPMNQLILDLATEYGLRVADLWPRTGPPWRFKYSADYFHPNDLGYADWTEAFTETLSRPVRDGKSGQPDIGLR